MRPKKVILLVDHNETTLSVRTFLLETYRYRVITALDSFEAWRILGCAAPDSIDLLVCELLMPGMDGNELCQRAKAIHPLLPCLITSATVSDATRATAANGFLGTHEQLPAVVLERISILVAKRRGPKKHVAPTYVTVRESEAA